jgi:superfamily II DNA/RNA helicase
VLDEADLLLSFGHEDDIAAIAAKLPRGCQCMLVSATVRRAPPRLLRCAALGLYPSVCARARPRYPGRLHVPPLV